MIKLTAADLRQIFPRAPAPVIEAFAAKQDVLAKAGILDTPARLAFFFANIDHECAGFTIPNLTENINYTAVRMAKVWPNRFTSASAVQNRYGSAPGWQLAAFDDIYGNRMGNRPGTSDGSTFIGRGGPQITGRDGYAEIGKRIGVDLVPNPLAATRVDLQPAICAAFWSWKNLNAKADAGDFVGCVRLWNGGTNGLADRQAQLARISAILKSIPVTTPPPDPAPAQPDPQPSAWAAFFVAVAGFFKGKSS